MELALPFLYSSEPTSRDPAGLVGTMDDRPSQYGRERLKDASSETFQINSPLITDASKEPSYADANVFCLRFSEMVSVNPLLYRSPVRCRRCCAVMNHLSTVVQTPDGRITWHCEFCNHENGVRVRPQELPHTDRLAYAFSSPPDAQQPLLEIRDETIVVFCIDSSGSMGTIVEMPEPIAVKNRKTGERRSASRVTRLQAVQAAVDKQIKMLAVEYPHRRAAIVAFDDVVTYLGDGSAGSRLVVRKDLMTSRDKLTEIGCSIDLPGPVGRSCELLSLVLHELEEGGFTALGPALTFAVALAGRVPGSKVLLCCDGAANVGVAGADATPVDSFRYHSDLGAYASGGGVSISVVALEGGSCDLTALSVSALRTGGKVIMTDVACLEKKFDVILRDNVIAMHAEAKFVTDRNAYVQDGFEGYATVATYFLGNVMATSDKTFKIGVRSERERLLAADRARRSDQAERRLSGASASTLSGSLQQTEGSDPISVGRARTAYLQVQVEYNNLSGVSCLSVHTVKIPILTCPRPTFQDVRAPVIGLHGAQMVGRLLYQSDLAEVPGVLGVVERLLLMHGVSLRYVKKYISTINVIRKHALRVATDGDPFMQADAVVAASYKMMTECLSTFKKLFEPDDARTGDRRLDYTRLDSESFETN